MPGFRGDVKHPPCEKCIREKQEDPSPLDLVPTGSFALFTAAGRPVHSVSGGGDMGKDDESIKRDIVERLYRDGRMSGNAIQVSVVDGVAVLGGSVRSHESRRFAIIDAWSVKGVSEVRDEMALEYEGPVPPDEKIELRAGRLLEWNPDLDHAKIFPAVTGGVVVLEGSVPSYWKKLKAEDLVSQVTGVLVVDNRLSVVPSLRMDDETLARDVRAAIEAAPTSLSRASMSASRTGRSFCQDRRPRAYRATRPTRRRCTRRESGK